MRKNTCNQVFNWFTEKKQLRELILGPDGCIYLSTCFEDAADWSQVYYNGNIFLHQDEDLCCLGELPIKYRKLPIITGNTTCYPVEGCACLLVSQCPVLDEEMSVFAVFRYKDVLALYMADSLVSRRVYLSLVEYTPEDEMFYTKIFSQLICRHDPDAVKILDTWLNHHTTCDKEE